MLLSSAVIAVYIHIPHMMKADKAIEIYKINFMFLPPSHFPPASVICAIARLIVIAIQPTAPFVWIYQFCTKRIAVSQTFYQFSVFHIKRQSFSCSVPSIFICISFHFIYLPFHFIRFGFPLP